MRRVADATRRGLDYLGLRRTDIDRSVAYSGDYGVEVAKLHDHNEREVGRLNPLERKLLRRIQLFGTTGAILIAMASLGIGLLPVVGNPIAGQRLWSLPARMVDASLAIAIGGTMILTVAWLMLGRYAIGRFRVEVAEGRSPARRVSRSQLQQTMVMWSIPMAVAPPILSKDVYSYLAQSKIAHLGLDPYIYSPLGALGADDRLTMTVPNVWRNTPAPYGPLFLWIGEHITMVTGDNIVAGVLLHRLVAICGVVMIVWALPRIARRCGVSAAAALWLGALNPLTIMHLVGGVHNEALMIGMMMIGLEFTLRATDSPGPLWDRNRRIPTAAGWFLVAGAALITASAMIKVTSMLALGFTTVALARRWGATLPALRGRPVRQWWGASRDTFWKLLCAGIFYATVMVVVTGVIALATGLGFGWMGTLSTGSIARSWLSVTTQLSVAAGFLGMRLGMGEQTQSMLDVAHPIGQVIAAILVVRWLLASLAGRIHPVGGVGISMATVVFLSPFVQAWYLLWAIVPLAAWATSPGFRRVTVGVSALISVIVLRTTPQTPLLVTVTALASGLIIVTLTSVLFFADHPVRRHLRRRKRAKEALARSG